MSYIAINHLKYHYPNTEVLSLNDINLEIEKGSFVGIVGENGAGKSTFCYALAGLVPNFFKGAYGGSILIDDAEVAKTPVARLCRKVGLVFQNPFNQLSGAKDNVFEEVAFGLQNFGIPKEEIIQRVNKVLDLLEISEYKERNPFDLSGGQMQRVAIASVLVMNPEVLILDEPTSQLDPAGSEEIFQVVTKLKKTGITIIMVEQKIEKLAQYCDQILLLHQGKQIDFGAPDSIFSRDDLFQYGIKAPAYTELCKHLHIKKANGLFPATLEDTLLLRDQFSHASKTKNKLSKNTTVPETVFDIQEINFSYFENTPVLQDLNLQLHRQATAIVGQNGAGKTTLVKLLKGLLRPVTGQIFYLGNDIKEKTVAMLASQIGYVFQNPDDQIFKYKVIDEVMFGPVNIGMKPETARQKAMDALCMMGLEQKAMMNPYDLELHERKLVAIASVLAMDTQVLILDEPTIAQDVKGRMIIGKMIRELTQNGKTVISILHDMDFVASYFDRIIVMRKGEVIASGTREEIFAQQDILSEARIDQPYLVKLCHQLGFEALHFDIQDFK